MAFCGKCGTQIEDGVKFCPKCGQPTGNADDIQHQAEYKPFNDQEDDDTTKTWHKVVCVLFWPIGLIMTIVAFFQKRSGKAKSLLIYTIIGIALGIVINVCFGGCNSFVEGFNEGYNSSSVEDGYISSDEEVSDVEEAGYQDGYEFGFEVGNEYIDEGSPSISYSTRYGAPSTPEEKQQYKAYERAYKRGFSEGRKAKN